MHRYLGSARPIIATLLIAAAWLLPGSAAAQDTTMLQVGAILCQDADCIDHDTLVPGFTISAIDNATGDVLDSCTTSTTAPSTCMLELPAGANWILNWDLAPDGYVWRGNLYPVADGPFGSATLIPFVPAQPTEPTVAPTQAPIVIEEPGHVTVQAGLCTDATCHEITEFLDLFIISAVDPDTGEEFSGCATGNAQQGLDHQCILDVPHDGNFALTWIPDQVPAGYVPFGEPFDVGNPAVLTLGFIPDTPATTPTIAPTSAAITQLPSTGSGPDANATPLWTALMLATAGTLLTALALSIRIKR